MQQRLKIFFLMFAAGLLLQGCSSTAKREEIPVWPGPPEQPRYKYETELRFDGAFTGETNSLMGKLAGKEPSSNALIFAKPYDVAAYGGIVVVSDSAYRVLHLFHVPTRKLYRVGVTGPGRLAKPAGVAIDGEQRIYAADVTAKKVMVYELSGHFLKEIGVDAGFERPTDVAVNRAGDRIYVVDTGGVESLSHRVMMFDGEGNLLREIGTRGGGEGEFNLPVQAAVAPDGTLYVLDAGNFRVQAFTAEGDFLRAWGKVGRNMGDFARPRGIAVDAEGHVYVADSAYANFQVFTGEGRLLLPVGGPAEDKPGGYSLPAGVAVDETGRVYLVDQRYKKVDVIKKLPGAEQ